MHVALQIIQNFIVGVTTSNFEFFKKKKLIIKKDMDKLEINLN
jgi:hypothetical protein